MTHHPSTAVCIVICHPLVWCQQHVVHRLETEPLRLLDHAHGTVYQSSSPTARHLSPSGNISRLIYLVYLFRARIDCVKRPCNLVCYMYSPGRLRRYNFVTLHYKNVNLWNSLDEETVTASSLNSFKNSLVRLRKHMKIGHVLGK